MTGVRIRLDTTAIQMITLFESITKACLKDCFDLDDETLFVVGTGDLKKALGINASNVRLLERKFNKKIFLLEFNKEPQIFAANILRPIPIKETSLENNILHITINSSLRAFPSKKVKKTKMLIKKYFPSIEEVIIKV